MSAQNSAHDTEMLRVAPAKAGVQGNRSRPWSPGFPLSRERRITFCSCEIYFGSDRKTGAVFHPGESNGIEGNIASPSLGRCVCAHLISLDCPGFPNLRCVRVARRAPVDLNLRAGLERAPRDVQTP